MHIIEWSIMVLVLCVPAVVVRWLAKRPLTVWLAVTLTVLALPVLVMISVLTVILFHGSPDTVVGGSGVVADILGYHILRYSDIPKSKDV